MCGGEWGGRVYFLGGCWRARVFKVCLGDWWCATLRAECRSLVVEAGVGGVGAGRKWVFAVDVSWVVWGGGGWGGGGDCWECESMCQKRATH